MQYAVIIEHHNGSYRALIPTLPNISAEGGSRDDVFAKVRQAADNYLADVEVIEVEREIHTASSPQAWLRATPLFPDDELFRQHLAEIAADKELQRQEAQQEADLAGIV